MKFISKLLKNFHDINNSNIFRSSFATCSGSTDISHFYVWVCCICCTWMALVKTIIPPKKYTKGSIAWIFRPKVHFAHFGLARAANSIFRGFLLPAPTLVMSKGLLTFAGPQNAQNNDFFMYTKTGLDLKNFDQIWKIRSGSPVSNRKKKFSRELFMYS